jgi:hypothetical protein
MVAPTGATGQTITARIRQLQHRVSPQPAGCRVSRLASSSPEHEVRARDPWIAATLTEGERADDSSDDAALSFGL